MTRQLRQLFSPTHSLLLIFALLAASSTVFSQSGIYRIVVTGRNLPLAVTAEKRGERLFLPVVPIARELGYFVSIDSAAEIVKARRGGIEAEFVKATATVRENGVTIAAVPLAAEVVFAASPDLLLLPVEVLSPLLDVSITVDNQKNAVKIESRQVGTAIDSKPGSTFEVGSLNYSYTSNSYNGTFYQNLSFSSTGRIGSSIYQSNINLIGGRNYGFLGFYSGNFTLLRKQGDEFQAGDLIMTTGRELTFLNTLARGGAYTRPIFSEKGKVILYGGLSSSGVNRDFFSFDQFLPRRSPLTPPFDTKLIGARFSFSPDKLKNNSADFKSLTFSAGTVWFDGKQNKGFLVDGAARYNSKRLNLLAEVAVGSFDVEPLFSRPVKGFGTGMAFSATYTPWRLITLQGRYENYSPNFTSPTRTAQYTNRDSTSFGVSVRPFSNLSFGASASVSHNRNTFFFGGTNISGFQTRTFSFNFAYNPEVKFLPRVSASATKISTPFIGDLTIVTTNFSRDFKNIRPFVSYFLTIGNGNTGHGVNLGVNILAGKFGQFQVQQGFALNRALFAQQNASCSLQFEECLLAGGSGLRLDNHHGIVDWSPRNRLFKVFQFNIGGGYIKDPTRTSLQFRTAGGLYLPFKQFIEVSYFRTIYNNELRFSVSGPLAFWKSKERLNTEVTNTSLLTESKVHGRIYLDENGNRQYDAGDIALKNTRVRLDNGIEVVSDINGLYTFDQIPPGDHLLAVNIEDVRADLVPANGLEQTITILPQTIVNTAFRMVRSGSLSGRIWHDKNNNDLYDFGEGLPDIHILSSSGRDTYTDPDGSFLLSELPPGEQTIFIDERYHPEDLMTASLSLRAEVKSGVETKNIAFIFKTKPRQIKEIDFGSKTKSNPPSATSNDKDKDKDKDK